MSIRDWSTTPGSNNASPPNGWPEGQAPSSVNNVGRQMMAEIRDSFEALPFFDFGHDPTRIDNDTFTVATDLTATYTVGRRLKLVGATTGYATIASSSYSAPDTTVNVTMDSGNVPTSLLTVSLGPDANNAIGSVPSTIVKYDITPAEIAAGWIPTNYAYPPGDGRRHGCVGDGTTDDTVAVQKTITLSAGYFNSTRTAAQRGIAAAYFPGGAYLCTDQITVPDGACIKGDNDAVFFFDDGGSGEYLFKNGADGVQGGYLHWAGKLYIVLKTVTAKGFWLMNSVSSRFDNIYVEGLVDGVLTSRTNVGFRLDTTAGIDSFHNEFPSMDFNHCHTGFYSPASGGTTTKQFFGNVRCYGDRISGDTTSRGFDIEGCQDSTLESGYFESYGVGAGAAAFRLATSASVRWKVSNITFDDQAANMNCIVLAGAGTPQYNQFLGCTFGSNSLVVDGTTAVDGNFIENNPNIAATGTATLVPLTSGTITLTAGAGGNQYFCERRGRMVRVWGKLNVASVSSPVGRLTIGGLPFTVANNASNFAPALIRISDFNNTMESTVQGYATPNSTTIEIERWVLGAVATDTAAQIKAGSVIVFDCTYAAA